LPSVHAGLWIKALVFFGCRQSQRRVTRMLEIHLLQERLWKRSRSYDPSHYLLSDSRSNTSRQVQGFTIDPTLFFIGRPPRSQKTNLSRWEPRSGLGSMPDGPMLSQDAALGVKAA
jgi:hypothetical protein